jgi:hypothetical protein
MIYMIRKITSNFMKTHKDRSVNGLPINMAPIVDDFDDSVE